MNGRITITELANAPRKPAYLVQMSGEIDRSCVDEEVKKVHEILQKQAGPIFFVFDLRDLRYIASKGIGEMTDWYQRAVSQGGSAVLFGPRENIFDILDLVGLTQLMKVCATQEEAISALAG